MTTQPATATTPALKIRSQAYYNDRTRRQVTITAIHPTTRFPFNKAMVAPTGMNDDDARAWATTRMLDFLQELSQDLDQTTATPTNSSPMTTIPAALASISHLCEVDTSFAPIPVRPVVQETPKPAPLPTLTTDGTIGQIEIVSGLTLRRRSIPGLPVGEIVMDEEDLGKLFALCQYKIQVQAQRAAAAMSAAQAEVRVDRQRFLDVSKFQATLPDMEISEYVPISKQAPSPEQRALRQSAGQKMSNTKRIQRFAPDGKGPGKADHDNLNQLVKFLAADPASSCTADDALECLPLGLTVESCAAMLDYLARKRVISCVGTGDARRYQAASKSVDALTSLLG